ncbi:MAG: hypothetical protein ACOX75_07350 [Lachnospiraceae bacterium]
MYSLKLYYDTLAPGAKAEYIEAQHSVCYVLTGSAVINDQKVGADECVYCQDYVLEEAGPEGCVIWRWELERTAEKRHTAEGEGVESVMRMAREVGMFKLVPTGQWMFRLDCIYDCAGSTGLHSHPGSGIRSMVEGHMKVESSVGENSDNNGCGAVWYEEGAYPVVSTVEPGTTCRFMRCMVMPAEYMECTSESPNWIEGAKAVQSSWKGYFQKVVTLR